MKINCFFVPNSEFTVGEIRTLNCQGSFDSVNVNSLSFSNIENPYALKILKAESPSSNQLNLIVTGYQPGSYSLNSLQITDGTSTYFTGDISWNIPSVIKNKETQMHPPYGPLNPYLPDGFKAGVFLITALLLFLIFNRIKNKLYFYFIKKRVQKRLQQQTPLNLFIKEITPLTLKKEKSEEVVSILESSLYEYLENKFNLSLFASSKKRKKLIKKSKIKESDTLLKIIIELDQLKAQKVSYSEKDLDQLVHMVRTWVFNTEES